MRKQSKDEKKRMKEYLNSHGLKKGELDSLFGLDDTDGVHITYLVETLSSLCKSFPKA